MQTDWSLYLDPDERLLWEGAPSFGLRIGVWELLNMMVGLLFFCVGFAICLAGSSKLGDGEEGIFGPVITIIIGIPFAYIGARFALGPLLLDPYIRAKTEYAVTNKRALIAAFGVRRRITSWPISPSGKVDYIPGRRSTILFSEIGNGQMPDRVGFELIADGDQVYRLIRQVQRGTA